MMWKSGGSVVGYVQAEHVAAQPYNTLGVYAGTAGNRYGVLTLRAGSAGTTVDAKLQMWPGRIQMWADDVAAGGTASGTILFYARTAKFFRQVEIETDMFVDGDAWFANHVALGNSANDTIDFNGRSTQNITPNTSGNLDLGDGTHGWRYLYLHDGTDEWRVSINTGGTLVTTKIT